mmetsp:Transcript_50845/g.132170  ORF Transcript_50845/g.132170 Transcript_50845/m.132170 type:complete len:175 (-) Transcript_50845:277-801(-)
MFLTAQKSARAVAEAAVSGAETAANSAAAALQESSVGKIAAEKSEEGLDIILGDLAQLRACLMKAKFLVQEAGLGLALSPFVRVVIEREPDSDLELLKILSEDDSLAWSVRKALKAVLSTTKIEGSRLKKHGMRQVGIEVILTACMLGSEVEVRLGFDDPPKAAADGIQAIGIS